MPACFVSNFAVLQSYSVLAREQLRKREHPSFDDLISYMILEGETLQVLLSKQTEAYRVICIFLLAKELFNAETQRR